MVVSGASDGIAQRRELHGGIRAGVADAMCSVEPSPRVVALGRGTGTRRKGWCSDQPSVINATSPRGNASRPLSGGSAVATTVQTPCCTPVQSARNAHPTETAAAARLRRTDLYPPDCCWNFKNPIRQSSQAASSCATQPAVPAKNAPASLTWRPGECLNHGRRRGIGAGQASMWEGSRLGRIYCRLQRLRALRAV